MEIRDYIHIDEKEWVYTKALSYLASPFFDDISRIKDTFDNDLYQSSIELVAIEDNHVIELLDIGIYTKEMSQKYNYYSADKVAYFTNLAVHPDHQNKGIASKLFKEAERQLVKQQVNALAIFTRDVDAANHLYKKWGAEELIQDFLVIGTPKNSSDFIFDVDVKNKRLKFTDSITKNEIPYYLSTGVYIVSKEENLKLFDIEEVYKEITYLKTYSV